MSEWKNGRNASEWSKSYPSQEMKKKRSGWLIISMQPLMIEEKIMVTFFFFFCGWWFLFSELNDFAGVKIKRFFDVPLINVTSTPDEGRDWIKWSYYLFVPDGNTIIFFISFFFSWQDVSVTHFFPMGPNASSSASVNSILHWLRTTEFCFVFLTHFKMLSWQFIQ